MSDDKKNNNSGGNRRLSPQRRYMPWQEQNKQRAQKQQQQQQETTPVPSKKIKLRLDVKDVVRKRDVENTAEQEGITVLFEDNHLLVAIKPQNMPTQADASGDPDFLSELKAYLVKKYDKPGDAFLGLVHRLDRPTGGVMVFAKTSKAASRLCEQIRDTDGDFEKTYLAVVNGRPLRTGRVEHYLVKDEKTNTVTVAPSTLEGAKIAQSDISIIDEKNGHSLVSVELITGRSHQARVQLKTLGSPIIGDVRYAGNKLVKSPHLALWAHKLAFNHPISGEKLRFLALPPDEYPWSEFDTEALIDIARPKDGGHY